MDTVGRQAKTGLSCLGGSVRDSYGFLGTVLLTSVLWFVVSIPVITMGPATAAAFYVVRRAVLHEDIGLRDFFTGLRRFFWRGLGVGVALAGGLCVIVVDMLFFTSMRSTILRMFAGVWVYAALFALGMSTYAFGLLVEQDTTAVKALKRSALLVLDNPVYTLIILLGSAVIAAACVVLAPAVMLLMAGVLGFVHVNSVRGLLGRYGVLEESPEEPEEPTEGVSS